MKIYNVDYYVPIQLMVLIYVVLIIKHVQNIILNGNINSRIMFVKNSYSIIKSMQVIISSITWQITLFFITVIKTKFPWHTRISH